MDKIGNNAVGPYGYSFNDAPPLKVERRKEPDAPPVAEQQDVASFSPPVAPGKSQSTAGKSKKTGEKRSPEPDKKEAQGDKDSDTKKKPEPGEVTFRYVCSKGDVEYHTAAESDSGVRAHEERHISDYYRIADKNGLQVVNPDIVIYHNYMPELEMYVATGGQASCAFAAQIDGITVLVPVTRDGDIADSDIARRIKEDKAGK